MIFLGWVRTPFPPLDPKLTLQMFCSWFEDVHVMCFGHYRQIISLSLFYELVIQLQVDICILDTILMLPEFGPESGALATVGEFVLCVTMT